MNLQLQRLNDAFHFEVSNETGQSIQLDSSPDAGGENLGMRPMETVIAALLGCSSIDVVMILQKGKQSIRDYKVEARAERRDEIPRIFTEIYLHFHLYGEIDPAKAERAIKLSMEKYCSVTKILEPTANIHTELTIHP
ncbi:MAG: OsmC family protein [Bacteroidia bacterium]